MVSCDPCWNLDFPARLEIARGGLEEEERFLRYSVVQLLYMIGIVPANSDDLLTSEGMHSERPVWRTFLPCFTKEATAAMIVTLSYLFVI